LCCGDYNVQETTDQLSYQNVSLLYCGNPNTALRSFQLLHIKLLLEYDRSYFDFVLAETVFSVIYLAEEFLESDMPDLLKYLGVSHLTTGVCGGIVG
jgi:hypothetical protein